MMSLGLWARPTGLKRFTFNDLFELNFNPELCPALRSSASSLNETVAGWKSGKILIFQPEDSSAHEPHTHQKHTTRETIVKHHLSVPFVKVMWNFSQTTYSTHPLGFVLHYNCIIVSIWSISNACFFFSHFEKKHLVNEIIPILTLKEFWINVK